MRHRDGTDRLSRPRAQRLALKRSLVRALFLYERIKTSPRKAKAASIEADRLITLAKRGDLHARRLAFSFLNDHQLTKRLFDEIAPRFKEIGGGYTRIIKLVNRKGDNAPMSLLELTQLSEKELPVRTAPARIKEPVPVVEKGEVSVEEKESSKREGTFKENIKKMFRRSGKKE
jgi:large subunit ribosomal protein L17